MSRDLAKQRLAAWTDKVDRCSGMDGPVR